MFRRQRVTAENPDPAARDGADDGAAAEPELASAAETESVALTHRGAVTAGKGRPTPKRSESQRRRQPIRSAPRDRKQAAGQARQERARRMEAMRAGEDWALSARDRGKVRGLARDYVDSRRRLSEFYMYGLVVLMVLLFVRVPVVQAVVPLIVAAGVVVMIAEGTLIGRRVRDLAGHRFPGESTQGVRWYAAMRALQIRQLRVPKPRVRPGAGGY